MLRNLWADRDERAVAIEHRAGWVAYQAVGYALLVDMVLHAWRPGIMDQTLGLLDTGFPIDIPLVMLVGGLAQWAVIVPQRIVGRRRAAVLAIMLVASVLLAVGIAWLLARIT